MLSFGLKADVEVWAKGQIALKSWSKLILKVAKQSHPFFGLLHIYIGSGFEVGEKSSFGESTLIKF